MYVFSIQLLDRPNRVRIQIGCKADAFTVRNRLQSLYPNNEVTDVYEIDVPLDRPKHEVKDAITLVELAMKD